MEKEIYITQAPYNHIQSTESHLIRQKSAPTIQPIRSSAIRQNVGKFLHRIPHESYYDNKILKPGITLYKNIVEIEEKRMNGEYQGPMLKINMPEVVMLNDNTNCLLYSEGGIVKFDENITNESFIARLGVNKNDNVIEPVVVHSSISGIDFNNSILMSNEIFANKIVPRSQGFIIRKFVQPFASTPNLLRLYFTPASSRSIKKNYAHKMVNTYPMNQQLFKKKHRQTYQYMVNADKNDSYTLMTVKGKSLQIYEKMAQSLTQYLEKGYPTKIIEMVLDFVVDQDKQPWLLEVKGIKSRNLTKLWDIGTIDEICLLAEKNNNSQLCKLCRMSFSKQELQKIVTNKLIWEVTDHIKYRGLSPPNLVNLRKTGLSNVCQLCYDILVAEHSLIEVENQLSTLINNDTISVEKDDRKKYEKNQSIWEEDDFSKDNVGIPKLKAWRLFFYLERVKYTDSVLMRKPVNLNLEMKFGRFKETFSKHMPQNLPIFNPIKSRFTSFSRAESAKYSRKRPFDDRSNKQYSDNKGVISQTTMASKITGSQLISRENIGLKKVKIFSFYTKKHQSQLFDDCQLEINLTLDDHKFQGRTLTLQQLKNRDLCQRHSSEVFLFDKKLGYCNLQLTVGLICDGEADPDMMSLQQTDGIYYSVNPHKMCLPLPNEWMEVFTKGEYIPSCENELTYQEIKQQMDITRVGKQ